MVTIIGPVKPPTTTVGKNISTLPTKTVQTAVGAKSDGIYGSQTTAAVKAFQKANGLVADGIVGPKTQAAIQKASSGTTTSSAGSTGSTGTVKTVVTPSTPLESADTINARNEQSKYLNSLNAPNEDRIYQDTLNRFQSEIDAQNAIFADEISRSKVQGLGRLGTQTAINARRGLIGSDFGEAAVQGTENANNEVLKQIDNEKAAKIQSILTMARSDAAAQIKAKREEFVKGLDARLAFYSAADQRKTDNTSKAVKSLISQGLNVNDVPANDLSKFAKYYGISVDDIKAQYDSEKQANDAEKAKIAAETAKLQPASVQEYEYAKLNGYTGSYSQYQNDDANRKAVVVKAGNTSGLTPYQQFTATQSISKDTQARTTNAREMARQAALIDNSYNNILNGGDKSLNTQAIVVAFNKILDPTSVVREGEYDRTAAGQSLLSRLEGKVQNIASGGAGVTAATLKEAADIAKQYLAGAQESIAQQNARAEALAKQFGLNPEFVGSVSVQGVGNNAMGSQETNPDPLNLGI